MTLEISQSTYQFDNKHTVTCQPLIISNQQHTVITGLNGSGKSVLASVLANQGQIINGHRRIEGKVGWVSVASQQLIIEAERKKDDADILDIIPKPSTVLEIIQQKNNLTVDNKQLQELVSLFGINDLLDREFLALSTGETRKVIIIQQLLSQPDWLILDEPYDGLDAATCKKFAEYLCELIHHCTLIMVVNRISEIPKCTRQILFLENFKVAWQVREESTAELAESTLEPLKQIMHIHQNVAKLPDKDKDLSSASLLDTSAPLVQLKEGRVAWGDNVIFENLNWTINPSEHWQIIGPNGSGKTSLLSMITGDNPLCYTNNLTVFGYKRGSGESIWDIKQHLGLVSNAFHLQYRVNCSCLKVVCSGFYDSIGLYSKPTETQLKLSLEWLDTIGLSHHKNSPFQSLSFGDQRLILVARAMVKHPSLLILDEPCNGLDEINRIKVLTMLDLLARKGETTLLYVNHHGEDKIASIRNCLDMEDYRVKT